LTGACECCGEKPVTVGAASVPQFRCLCMELMVCKTCNRCESHCACKLADQQLDVPYTEQLVLARYEWNLLGVRL